MSSHDNFVIGELAGEEAIHRRANHWHPAEAEAPDAQIRTVAREHNLTEQILYRWCNKYGGMEVPDARRLKNLEAEKEFSRGK